MKITIRDVAKECRVSPFTVSSVINNKRAIKAETRQKVLDAIERLGYDPSLNVPHARKIKTDTFGLIVPRQQTANLPFYNRAVVAFANECSIAGFENQLVFMDDINERVKNGGTFPDCAGLIVYCPYLGNWKSWVEKLAAREIPLVLIRRRVALDNIISIVNDDEAGIRQGLEYLYGLGHTRIALAGLQPGHVHMKRHTPTFRTFMEQQGLPFDSSMITGLECNGEEYFTGWWHGMSGAQPPTALICHDDLVAFKVMHRLQQMGVRCPDDVSIIGFDDDYGDDGVAVPLTSLRIPVEEMIRVSVRMLADQCSGIRTNNAVIEMPVELKVRESTRVITGGDNT